MLACVYKKEADIWGNIRKKYDATLKAKIALEAVKGEKTIAEISSEYGVHSTQIAHWKKQLL